MDTNNLNNFVLKTESELLEDIGKEILGSAALPVDKQAIMSIGKSWFEKNRDKLKGTICSNQQIYTILHSERSVDRIMVLTAVADLLAPMVIGISPFTVAALVTKEGLFSFCESIWKKRDTK